MHHIYERTLLLRNQSMIEMKIMNLIWFKFIIKCTQILRNKRSVSNEAALHKIKRRLNNNNKKKLKMFILFIKAINLIFLIQSDIFNEIKGFSY